MLLRMMATDIAHIYRNFKVIKESLVYIRMTMMIVGVQSVKTVSVRERECLSLPQLSSGLLL